MKNSKPENSFNMTLNLIFQFQVKLEVAEYQPDELVVKITDNWISIEGKHEIKEENKFSSRQFSKKFTIPTGVEPENITSTLSNAGVLTISAPIEVTRDLESLQESTSDINNATSTNTQQATIEQHTQQQQSVTSTKHVQQVRQEKVVQEQQEQIQQQQQVQQQTIEQQNVAEQQKTVVQQQQQQNQTKETTQQQHKLTALNVAKHQEQNQTEECLLQPIIEPDSPSVRDVRFEDITTQLCRPTERKKFEVSFRT